MAVLHGEEVTLQLQTHVASVTSVLAYAVAEADKFCAGLGISAEAYGKGAHRVLKAETSLELSKLNPQLFEVLPLNESVHDAGAFVLTRRPVYLELQLVVEVLEGVAVHIQTHEAQVKGTV